MKGNKGITLIALVVTIIVLLILAGVAIAMLTGDNSILRRAQSSQLYNNLGAAKDEVSLAYNAAYAEFMKQFYDEGLAEANKKSVDDIFFDGYQQIVKVDNVPGHGCTIKGTKTSRTVEITIKKDGLQLTATGKLSGNGSSTTFAWDATEESAAS